MEKSPNVVEEESNSQARPIVDRRQSFTEFSLLLFLRVLQSIFMRNTGF